MTKDRAINLALQVSMAVVICVIVLGPNLYLQRKNMKEHQREFLTIQANSLESSLGVCKVLLDAPNPDLKDAQDSMRGICNKMQTEYDDVKKKLENL